MDRVAAVHNSDCWCVAFLVFVASARTSQRG